jgi:hypothetical protein
MGSIVNGEVDEGLAEGVRDGARLLERLGGDGRINLIIILYERETLRF